MHLDRLIVRIPEMSVYKCIDLGQYSAYRACIPKRTDGTIDELLSGNALCGAKVSRGSSADKMAATVPYARNYGQTLQIDRDQLYRLL